MELRRDLHRLRDPEAALRHLVCCPPILHCVTLVTACSFCNEVRLSLNFDGRCFFSVCYSLTGFRPTLGAIVAFQPFGCHWILAYWIIWPPPSLEFTEWVKPTSLQTMGGALWRWYSRQLHQQRLSRDTCWPHLTPSATIGSNSHTWNNSSDYVILLWARM